MKYGMIVCIDESIKNISRKCLTKGFKSGEEMRHCDGKQLP